MQEERDRSDCGSTCWMIGKSGPSHPPTGSGGGTRSFAPLPDPGAGWKRSNAPRPWRMRGSRLTGGSTCMIFKSGSPPHPERVEGRGGCGPQVRFQNRHIWKGRPLWRRGEDQLWASASSSFCPDGEDAPTRSAGDADKKLAPVWPRRALQTLRWSPCGLASSGPSASSLPPGAPGPARRDVSGLLLLRSRLLGRSSFLRSRFSGGFRCGLFRGRLGGRFFGGSHFDVLLDGPTEERCVSPPFRVEPRPSGSRLNESVIHHLSKDLQTLLRVDR
jgi:hypothetical protein